MSSVPLASFAGSPRRRRHRLRARARRGTAGLSTDVLLLAGVTLNAFFSALILFVQYLADFSQTFRTVRWLMGDLDVGRLPADRGGAAARRRGLRGVRVAAARR